LGALYIRIIILERLWNYVENETPFEGVFGFHKYSLGGNLDETFIFQV